MSRTQATHASWKGSITFGMVTVPVKLYTATEERKVAFNMVHGECGSRTKNKTVCPACERDVDRTEIVKGYDAGGQMVVLTDEDFDGLPLRSTRSIDVIAFVPSETVPQIMLDKPYFVAPAEDVGQKAFALLRDAMNLDVVAIAKLSRGGKEWLCAIRAYGRLLALHYLVWPDEVRAIDALEQTLEDVPVSAEEQQLAADLVKAMTRPDAGVLDEQQDGYREALLQVIEAKLEGREPVKLPTPRRAGADLMAALKASVDAAKAEAA